MSFQEELISAIEVIVNKTIEKYSNKAAKEIPSVVTDVSKGKYKVKLDGYDYWVKDGVNINPTVGMAVWVRVPTANLVQAYICAKR